MVGGVDTGTEGRWKWSGGPDDGKFSNDGGVANRGDSGYTVRKAVVVEVIWR